MHRSIILINQRLKKCLFSLYRIWHIFFLFFSHSSNRLHHILLFPSCLVVIVSAAGLGRPGWTQMTLRLYNVRTEQCEVLFVPHFTGSPSVSSCFSSQMCQSINDWCLPVGLDSSFTCSLRHSCSVGPNARHPIIPDFGKSYASNSSVWL